MKITVKSLQGDEYIVEVHNDQLVSDLKASISEKAAGLPIEKQKLVYKGRTMQDISLVSDYGLEEGCKVHLILQKDKNVTASTSSEITDNNNPSTTSSGSCNTWSSERLQHENTESRTDTKDQNYQKQSNLNTGPRSRFEIILREKLANHFASNVVDNILAVLEDEINDDINSSSLDDLERLAKQKLNITNE